MEIVKSSDIYQNTIGFQYTGLNLLDEDCPILDYNYLYLENIFKYNSYIQRVVMTYPGEITKYYPSILKNGKEDKNNKDTLKFHQELQKLNAKKILKDSLIKTNIYGSYLIFLKTNSNIKQNKELSENEIITQLHPYPFTKVGKKIEIENGVEIIKYYTLDGVDIHHSRVIRLDSSPVLHINETPPSLIQLVYPFYKNYIDILKTSRRLIKSQSTPVIMIKDLLSKLLRGGRDIRSKLLGRISLVNESLLKMNPIAVDKEQEAISFGERGLTGVSDTVEDAKMAFIGASEVPGSILFQQSSRGGLFGDSTIGERMFLSQTTRNKQIILDEFYIKLIKQNLSIEDFVLEYAETLVLTPLENAEMKEREARGNKMKEETTTLKLNNDKFKKCYMSCELDPPTSIQNPLSARNRLKEDDMTRTRNDK